MEKYILYVKRYRVKENNEKRKVINLYYNTKANKSAKASNRCHRHFKPLAS